MKYFYDTEFLDTGSVIHLISIGIIAEDGRTLHLVNADAPWALIKAHKWLSKNVLPYLDELPEDAWKSRTDLRAEVGKFLKSPMHTGKTELWAWHGGYDHVVLMQLLADDGDFHTLPRHIPWWTNDVRQKQWEMGDVVVPPHLNGVHNALEDAKYAMELYTFLESLRAS